MDLSRRNMAAPAAGGLTGVMNDGKPEDRIERVRRRTPAARTGPRAAAALRAPLLAAAAVATGLIAGMFFAYTFSVMPGLARVDDRTFVAAMQDINDATLESTSFMLTFGIAPLLIGAAAVVHHRLGSRAATRWILAALALYAVAFGTTMGVHLPLVEALDAAGEPGPDGLAPARADFEGPWNTAHTIRTVTGALALACLALAGTARERPRPWTPPSAGPG